MVRFLVGRAIAGAANGPSPRATPAATVWLKKRRRFIKTGATAGGMGAVSPS
ncbi:MAG: twin-arginine translocation signal domain-containing protein [Magnetococcales bacterium]|nr:twin-arginine translocation signal domain-containing protein [Magnetococcales bacterium]